MFKVGDKFHRTLFNSTVTVKEIVTHKIVEKKKVKLDRPIYKLQYDRWVSKGKTELTEVTMFAEDIKSQIDFNLWKVNQ